MHYYIKFGSEYSVENVTKVVNECITTQLIESKSRTRWIQFISSAHKEVNQSILCMVSMYCFKT